MKRQNKFLLTAALIASLMGGVSVQAEKQDPNAVAPNTQQPDPRIKQDSETDVTFAKRLAITAYDVADEARKNVTDLKTKIDGITGDSNKIGEIEKILNGNGADDKGLTGKVADINKVLSGEHGNGGLEENLKKLMETVNGDGNANSGLVGKVKANEEAITQHNTDISNLKKEIGEDDNNGLKKDIKEIKETIGDATKGLTKDVTDNKAGVAENKKLLVGEDGNGGLKKDVTDNKAGVAENKTAIAENKKLLVGEDGNSGLKKDVTDNKAGVAENKKLLVGDDGNSGLVKDVKDLQTKLGNGQTDGLIKDVKANSDDLGKLKEAIHGDQGLEKKIQQLEQNANVARDADVARKLEEINKKAQEVDGKLVDLEGVKRLSGENSKLLVGDDGNGGLKKDIKEIKEAIGDATKGLKKDVTDNKAGVAENKKLLVGDDGNGGLKKDVETNKAAIGDENSGLTKKVNDNKKAIDENKAAIGDENSGLTKKVNDNKKAIDENKVAIGDENSGLTKKVNDNEKAIGDANSGLTKKVNTNEKDIKDLKEHKADLSKLNSDVDALKGEDARIEQEYKAADVRLGMRMDQLATDTNKGMAKMAALASLHPLEYDGVNRFNVAVATGSYRGENAVAMGAFFRPSKDVLVSLSASLTGGDSAYGFGISARLGRSGGASYSGDSSAVSELYHLVGELQDKLEAQQRKIDELEARA